MPGKINTDQNKNRLRRGQSLIEFAVVLPILILLILGAMDFGRLFFTKIVLTNAAREGANFLSRNPTDEKASDVKESFEETKNVIENEAANSSIITVIIDCSNNKCPIECIPTDEEGCAQFGMATVTATKGVDLIFGSFLESVGLTSGLITLSSTVKMMVQ